MKEKTDNTKFIPKKDYRVCVKYLPVPTTDVVIFNPDQTKVLLFKRINKPLKGEFFTLGGRIIKGEDLKDSAIRKIEEEIGIKISSDQLIFGGIIDEKIEKSMFEDMDQHNINIFWGLTLPENTKIKLDSQHSEYKWFDINDPFHKLVRKKIDMIISEL